MQAEDCTSGWEVRKNRLAEEVLQTSDQEKRTRPAEVVLQTSEPMRRTRLAEIVLQTSVPPAGRCFCYSLETYFVQDRVCGTAMEGKKGSVCPFDSKLPYNSQQYRDGTTYTKNPEWYCPNGTWTRITFDLEKWSVAITGNSSSSPLPVCIIAQGKFSHQTVETSSGSCASAWRNTWTSNSNIMRWRQQGWVEEATKE